MPVIRIVPTSNAATTDVVVPAVPAMKTITAREINASKMAVNRIVPTSNAGMTDAVVPVVSVHPKKPARITNAWTNLTAKRQRLTWLSKMAVVAVRYRQNARFPHGRFCWGS